MSANAAIFQLVQRASGAPLTDSTARLVALQPGLLVQSLLEHGRCLVHTDELLPPPIAPWRRRRPRPACLTKMRLTIAWGPWVIAWVALTYGGRGRVAGVCVWWLIGSVVVWCWVRDRCGGRFSPASVGGRGAGPSAVMIFFGPGRPGGVCRGVWPWSVAPTASAPRLLHNARDSVQAARVAWLPVHGATARCAGPHRRAVGALFGDVDAPLGRVGGSPWGAGASPGGASGDVTFICAARLGALPL